MQLVLGPLHTHTHTPWGKRTKEILAARSEITPSFWRPHHWSSASSTGLPSFLTILSFLPNYLSSRAVQLTVLCSKWHPSAHKIKYELLTLAFKNSLAWAQSLHTGSLPTTPRHDIQFNDGRFIIVFPALRQLLIPEPLLMPIPSHTVQKPLAPPEILLVSVPLDFRRL